MYRVFEIDLVHGVSERIIHILSFFCCRTSQREERGVSQVLVLKVVGLWKVRDKNCVWPKQDIKVRKLMKWWTFENGAGGENPPLAQTWTQLQSLNCYFEDVWKIERTPETDLPGLRPLGSHHLWPLLYSSTTTAPKQPQACCSSCYGKDT